MKELPEVLLLRHPGRWTSFNTIGSVASSTAAPICLVGSGSKRYCYASCAARPEGCDAEGCDWTTCVNSTAIAVAVLDDVEAMLCVDVSREYATGQSNGGMFALRLGATLSTRLAAIVPISATFTYHHADAPNSAVAVLACSGSRDTVVPVNATQGGVAVASDGWLYEPLNDVFQEWRSANKCTDRTARWVTPLDGTRDLFCWGFVDCDAPVVRCAWNGSHQYFGNDAILNGQLVWSFLSQFSKPTHMGAGVSTGSLTIRHRAATPTFTRPVSDRQAVAHTPNLGASPRDGFYGTMCLAGDAALDLSDFRLLRVCAPPCDAAGNCPAVRPDAPSTVPACLLPSLFSSNRSHCVLTCNLSTEASDDDAGNCSPGAVCVSGYLRHSATGICAWRNVQLSPSSIDTNNTYA